jgi:hypothetical protein
MKTVLDIKKKPQYKPNDKEYTINSIDDVFNAIDDTLRINPDSKLINVRFNKEFIESQIVELFSKYGFEINNSFYPDYKDSIRFRGLTRWVYFKDDKPVHFDSTGSGTDTPSHLCSFPPSIFETLEYDRFEKITY